MVDDPSGTPALGIVQAGYQSTNLQLTTLRPSAPEELPAAVEVAARKSSRHTRNGVAARAPAVIRLPGHWARLLRRWFAANTSAWWRAANVLEYYKWFQSRLKLQAAIGLCRWAETRSLGRSSRCASRPSNYGTWWDEECLTEDCKIGILASVLGYPVDVVYMDHLVTREETPATLWGLLRQRVRWMQGFIYVFGEGDWRQLHTFSQRVIAVYVLGFQFFQAFSAVFAPCCARARDFPQVAGVYRPAGHNSARLERAQPDPRCANAWPFGRDFWPAGAPA